MPIEKLIPYIRQTLDILKRAYDAKEITFEFYMQQDRELNELIDQAFKKLNNN